MTWILAPYSMAPYPESDLYAQIATGNILRGRLGWDAWGPFSPAYQVNETSGGRDSVNITLQTVMSNYGGVIAPGVQIVSATLINASTSAQTTTALPLGLGTIHSGDLQVFNLLFPVSIGPSGSKAILRLKVTDLFLNETVPVPDFFLNPTMIKNVLSLSCCWRDFLRFILILAMPRVLMCRRVRLILDLLGIIRSRLITIRLERCRTSASRCGIGGLASNPVLISPRMW